jgi:hypothetical protein
MAIFRVAPLGVAHIHLKHAILRPTPAVLHAAQRINSQGPLAPRALLLRNVNLETVGASIAVHHQPTPVIWVVTTQAIVFVPRVSFFL